MRIDGKEIADKLMLDIASEVKTHLKSIGKVPTLAVILVGYNPASVTYVNNKEAAGKRCGIEVRNYGFTSTTDESVIVDCIQDLNKDDSVDGILVQLPLPHFMDKNKILNAISAEKDVDGLHPVNAAALWQGRKGIIPCTPKGIMKIFDSYGEYLEGKNAVVIGRSQLVGLPVAKLLLDRNCTVTICHSHTGYIKEITKNADIIVVAVGKPNFLTADMVKTGAVIIDVGINRVGGRLCGDVDYEAVAPKARAITPVPKGVGAMTIACLMENTLECFKIRNGIEL